MRKKKGLKRLGVALLLLALAFFVYVEIVNRNSEGMNYRQKILKAVYPAWMWITKLTGKNSKSFTGNKDPLTSFHALNAIRNDGTSIEFSNFRGRKVLLVNTASECGYTNQYKDLQELHERFADQLVILAFPANDFKEQEKGTDEEIAQFCSANFGVTFAITKKSVVVKSPQQNPVFQWLTDSTRNGWNEKAPSWNFSKYLVNEQGRLTHYFDPSISPLSDEVVSAVEGENERPE